MVCLDSSTGRRATAAGAGGSIRACSGPCIPRPDPGGSPWQDRATGVVGLVGHHLHFAFGVALARARPPPPRPCPPGAWPADAGRQGGHGFRGIWTGGRGSRFRRRRACHDRLRRGARLGWGLATNRLFPAWVRPGRVASLRLCPCSRTGLAGAGLRPVSPSVCFDAAPGRGGLGDDLFTAFAGAAFASTRPGSGGRVSPRAAAGFPFRRGPGLSGQASCRGLRHRLHGALDGLFGGLGGLFAGFFAGTLLVFLWFLEPGKRAVIPCRDQQRQPRKPARDRVRTP